MSSWAELGRNIGRTATGGLIVASMFQADCTPHVTPPSQPAVEGGRPTETQPIRNSGVAELLSAVDTLPASPLQQAVSSRLHRYYSNPQPMSVSYGDLSFSIVQPTVTINRNIDQRTDGVNGNFNYRKNTPRANVLSSVDQFAWAVPLNDLLLEGEINKLPKQYHGQNNRFIYPFNFPVGAKFVEAIQPAIEINSYESQRKFFTPKEQQDLIRATIVKEACSLALQDIFVTNVVDNMRALNLPTRIDAYTSNGERVNASPIVDIMAILSTNKGRFIASLDLGGYLLMFKLLEGTDVEQAFAKLPNYREAIDSAKRFNLPLDPNKLFAASVRWVNSDPVTQKLGHVGDFGLIP